ncbi:MAG TPA: CPBP family intramembrane glutamic endopeptidase [Kofleriaceae bacterium]|jgi:membrane protease YdiL (CAAX protease family)
MTSVIGSTAAVITALVLLALMIRRPEPAAKLRACAVAPLWLAGLVVYRIPGLWWLPQLLRWIPGLVLRAPEIFVEQWRAIDAETVREPGDAGRASTTVLAILFTVAASLTLQEYLGGHDTYERLFPHDGSHYWELRGYVWWSGWRAFGYVGIPMIVLACLPGQRIRDYHVSLRGFFHHLWIYAALFALILPAVLIASTTRAFRETYPFYRIANRSLGDLAMWEALYAAQFLSLEFFFRGFLLHGLRRALGANAIFVMLVPYCMIHYGKPLPETLGAIGAGLILGTLAMRTRSIWGGVLIHVGVASTMDVLALRGCPPIGGSPCH